MSYCSALYVSLAILIIGLIGCGVALKLHKHVRIIFIGMLFSIAVVVFYPVSVDLYPDAGKWPQFFISAYQALKVFLIDGELNEIQNTLQAALAANTTPGIVINIYEVVIFVLLFVAPITTATVILSFFSNITANLHLYTIGRFRDLYVFSELNDKSLALAKDIRGKHKRATLIFNDVYRKNEETQTELVEDAKKIGGLCFQRDIMHMRIKKFKHKIEFFIIGLNESENIRQAIGLTKDYKDRLDTRIYVWARSPESCCILDSIELYDKKKDDKTEKPVEVTEIEAAQTAEVTEDNAEDASGTAENKEENVAETNEGKAENKESDEVELPPVISDDEFRLRRIDDIEIFAWNTLREANLFAPEKCIRHGGENLISILIIGMGDYGKEFLKCAVWMYQMIGYRLEINVVDRENCAQKQMWHQCPELMKMNDCTEEGEGHYSIRFIENVDIFTNDFDDLFFNDSDNDPEIAARLKRTTAVFVTLGDDDTNIRAALEIRNLFDRVHYEKYLKKAENENRSNVKEAELLKTKSILTEAEKEKIKELFGSVNNSLQNTYTTTFAPEIYAPVYDTLKAENITLQSDAKKEVTQLRSYENVPFNIHFKGSFNEQYSYDKITRNQLENDAIAYHLQWKKFKDWKEAFEPYKQYEYYRRSSMAQAIHKEMMLSNFSDRFECTEKGDEKPNHKIYELKTEQNCHCLHCMQSKLVEHMRWNVYMRTEGFSLPVADPRYKIKQSRAKLHCDLVVFSELDELEKAKDSTIRKNTGN